MCKALVIMFILVMGSVVKARSQTVIQLAEQLALDYQKLSELKSILQDMYDAYKVMDKGLSDVKGIVNGNFNLHQAFLDGLLAVSPAVKNYARVADIVSAEYTIVSEYTAGLSKFKSSGHFSGDEITYIGNVYSNLLSRSTSYVNELIAIITSNQLRMGDAERLAGIDRVYDGIVSELVFLRRFNGATSIQDVQRAKQSVDLGVLNSLY
jgi:DNA repair ATPase RecN